MTPSRQLMIDLSTTQLTPDEREMLASRRFGGLCVFGRNITDRFQLADYLAEVRSLAGADFIVAIDQEGGGVLRLHDVPYPPGAMALGAAADPGLTRAVAAATARGLRAVGVNVDFAPVADVNVNALNPVIADRSFGSDPQAVAEQVAAFISGLQSEGVAATVKHFPGHGDTATDSHLALPTLQRSLEELGRLELPPFRAAVEHGVAAVMTAHIMFPQLDPQLPATLSPVVLRTLLRDMLGFTGVIFSDALDMKAVADHYTPVESNLLALQAGVDMPLNIGPVRHHLDIADGVDRALRDGELQHGDVAAGLARLERLSGEFPARPAVQEAWREGDEELLERAASAALVRLGNIPVLERGRELTLVAAQAVWTNAANQQRVSPGDDLATEFRRHGLDVRHIRYDPELLGKPGYETGLLAELGPGEVLFVSSRRTPLSTEEVRFAEAVRDRAGARYVHIALWNPYHAARLPGPALLSFGFRPALLGAIARALLGAEVTGRLPIDGVNW